MFDVDKYLAVLGRQTRPEPTLPVLRDLHHRHLMAIPFDNSLNADRGVAIWNVVDIDVDAVFTEVVLGGRGGVCYELNGLFRTLLAELGYDVEIRSAGVRMANGRYGPDLEHMFSRVRLDGAAWLADVGFAGPSYLRPLRDDDSVQPQFGVDYRLVDTDGYRVLQRRPRDADWQPVYRFRPQRRPLADWNGPNDDLAEFAGELLGQFPDVRSRAFPTGQEVLIGKRLTTVDEGREQVRVLVRPDDFDAAVSRLLTEGR